jgi:glucose-1-phosphate adenylyltransferase
VLIVSGDHIYHMDYNALITYHLRKKSRATACLIRVPAEQASNFGIASLNDQGAITEWEEKPARPRSDLASMGIYVFERGLLTRVLAEAARKGGTDFARDVFPLLFKTEAVYGYEFSGYWRDVGTISAYWQTNMDLLIPNSGLDIYNWRVKTNIADRGEIGDRPSAYLSRSARVKNSLVSRGCVVEGEVLNSILSPGVIVQKGSMITDSIIFHDTKIAAEAKLCNVISDKDVTVEQAAQIGICGTDAEKRQRQFTIIGKGAVIQKKSRVTAGTVVKPTA